MDELPNLMRAMGFYPTDQEVKNIKDEVKYSEYTERAIPTTHVTLDRFITLFVNHRPVYGIGKNNIEEAFKDLCEGNRDSKDNSIDHSSQTFHDILVLHVFHIANQMVLWV